MNLQVLECPACRSDKMFVSKADLQDLKSVIATCSKCYTRQEIAVEKFDYQSKKNKLLSWSGRFTLKL